MDRETWEKENSDDEEFKPKGKKQKRGVGRKILFLIGSFIKHLAIIVFMITVVLVLLWGYTGSWPPFVVVQSGSMMHHETDSQYGAVDTGDLILYRNVDKSVIQSETTSWVDHEEKHYGTWGDVLIFEKNGEDSTPMIHRAVVWLEVNLADYDANTRRGATYDIPSMGLQAQSGKVVIADYPAFATNSSETTDLEIDLGQILDKYHEQGQKPKSGYITKGDNNPRIDQPDICMPVVDEWVMGKGGGEIPWLGLISLIYKDNPDPIPRNSILWSAFTLIILFGISINLEIVIKMIKKRRKKKKERSKKKDEKRIQRIYSKLDNSPKKKREWNNTVEIVDDYDDRGGGPTGDGWDWDDDDDDDDYYDD
jgi:signal peptidase I